MPRNRDISDFEGALAGTLKQNFGEDEGMQLFDAIYQRGGQGVNSTPTSLPVSSLGRRAPSPSSIPTSMLSKKGLWDVVGWLKNQFVGISRVREGGQNTIFGNSGEDFGGMQVPAGYGKILEHAIPAMIGLGAKVSDFPHHLQPYAAQLGAKVCLLFGEK